MQNLEDAKLIQSINKLTELARQSIMEKMLVVVKIQVETYVSIFLLFCVLTNNGKCDIIKVE